MRNAPPSSHNLLAGDPIYNLAGVRIGHHLPVGSVERAASLPPIAVEVVALERFSALGRWCRKRAWEGLRTV